MAFHFFELVSGGMGAAAGSSLLDRQSPKEGSPGEVPGVDGIHSLENGVGGA